MGFLLAILAGYCGQSCSAVSFCFSIGFCMLLKAFIENIIIDLNEFFEKMKKPLKKPGKKLSQKPIQRPKSAKQLFCNIVQDYCELKELSCKYRILFSTIFFQHSNFCRFISLVNEIFEFTFTNIFLWSLLTVCTSLLFLQFGFVEYQIELRIFQRMQNLFH